MRGGQLTLAEVQLCERILNDIQGITWISPLVDRITRAGGIKQETRPLLFELRFAWELHRLGLEANYEFPSGLGNSTVDFRLVVDKEEWLVELVSLQSSDAVKSATHHEGPVLITELSSRATDQRQTPEAAMIRAEEKILEKVYSDRVGPIKFPQIHPGRYHVIVSDMRGYLIQGGDCRDYRQMAYGPAGIPRDRLGPLTVQFWPGPTGQPEPIKGLFETDNPSKGARTLQERVHFLGFVTEKKCHEGSIQEYSYYLANPHLFPTLADALKEDVFGCYPMRRIS